MNPMIFLNIVGNISNKPSNEKEDVSPLQSLCKYFNEPFKDISWPYTSTKEINKIIHSLKCKNSRVMMRFQQKL